MSFPRGGKSHFFHYYILEQKRGRGFIFCNFIDLNRTSPCEHPDRRGGLTPLTKNDFINYSVLVVKIKITGNSVSTTLLEESTT